MVKKMIETMEKILKKAQAEQYAVAAYNVNNLEWARFILEASEDSKTPVILEVSESAVTYMGGFNVAAQMIRALVKDLKITVPVAIHLDHGKSVESCKQAIDAGFTSVMFDGSQLPLEENISKTKEVVNYAHQHGVTVEAEIGKVGGENSEIVHADPNECVRIVQESGIDFLAPALGSVHGLYHGEPHIDFDTTKKIRDLTGLPLVLHGGTGIPDEMLLEGIKSGICKVNINTELQIAWSMALRKYLNDNQEVYDPRPIMKSGEMAMKEEIVYKNKLLGSYGKAN